MRKLEQGRLGPEDRSLLLVYVKKLNKHNTLLRHIYF